MMPPLDGWEPPTFDGPCGPQELTEVVLECRRRFVDSCRYGPCGLISPAGLRKLIALAYQTGLQSDEGRYPRVRLFVPSQAHGPRHLMVRFIWPLRLHGPETIGRLAPTLPSEDYALLVQERDGELYCDGLMMVAEEVGAEVAGEVALGPRDDRLGLVVHVVGPGELRVAEGARIHRIRTGRIDRERPFFDARAVSCWLREVGQTVLRRCQEKIPNFHEPALELSAWQQVGALWSLVLLSARQLHHGAAFAVLPQPAQAPVHLRYSTESFSLSARLAAFFWSCSQSVRLRDQAGFAEAAAQWRFRKQGLLSSARALGNLSAADGCVVLDREMRLAGFGGIIAAAGRPLPLMLCVGGKGTVAAERELDRFGMRHRSAFQLCQACPNALVFVVSQDGDLRLFWSDDELVYLEEGLSPEWF